MSEEIIVIRTGFIVFFYGLLRQRFAVNGLLFHNLLRAVVRRGMEEHSQKVFLLPKHIVRTASHDDAIVCLSHLADHIELGKCQLLIERETVSGGCTGHVQAVDETPRGLFIVVLHGSCGKTIFLSSHSQNFLVIKGVSQTLGNLFADLLSAGAELPSDCDDHWNTAFPKIMGNSPTFRFYHSTFRGKVQVTF